jgi:hypothetical protein
MISKTKSTTKDQIAVSDDKAVAVKDENQFEIMTMQPGEIGDILKENLGAGTLSVQDLTKIKVPGSGGKVWSVPSVEGDTNMNEIDGVIIFTKTVRTYWVDDFDTTGGGAPPDCYSPDGVQGIGMMADQVKDALCSDCPMSKFKEDGSGCPCKEGRLIFIVMKDEILPAVVKAPVMSLKEAKKYLTGLTSRRQKVHSVYTRLSLENANNRKGIKYSKIMFKKIGDVERPELTAAYAETLRPFIDAAAAHIASEARDDTAGAQAYDPEQ